MNVFRAIGRSQQLRCNSTRRSPFVTRPRFVGDLVREGNYRGPPILRSKLLPGRESEDGFETTPEHALAVERHLRGIHRLLELRVLHDCLVDTLAIVLASVYDPRQCNHLAVLE